MEKNEVSIHEARLFLALRKAGETWATSKEFAKAADVADRTARAHLLKLSNLGIVDTAEVFPAHRYRLAIKASKRNGGYMQRLDAACAVFGLTV